MNVLRFYNPECHVAFWFDRVISNVLKRVSSNFKANTRFDSAGININTALAKSSANAIVCIKDLIVRNSDIAENIPGHEQGPIQRPPEMMMHHTPWHIRPDAHRTIPIVVDVT